MSRLLLDDEPLVILPKLAAAIGLNEAIILQQLHYWLEKSKNVKDGFRWVYNTYEEWTEQFPFWSESTIKRTVKKLEQRGLVIVGKYNKLKIDNTKWYRIDYEKLQQIESKLYRSGSTSGQSDQTADQNDQTSGQDEQTDGSKWPDGQVKMTRPLPETTTENTTDIVVSSSNVLSFYEHNFGFLNPYMADSIIKWVEDTNEELVMAAMEIALKQQKKWNYAEGILKQWVAANIKTLNDVKAAQEEFKKNKKRKGKVKDGVSNGRAKANGDFLTKYDFS